MNEINKLFCTSLTILGDYYFCKIENWNAFTFINNSVLISWYLSIIDPAFLKNNNIISWYFCACMCKKPKRFFTNQIFAIKKSIFNVWCIICSTYLTIWNYKYEKTQSFSKRQKSIDDLLMEKIRFSYTFLPRGLITSIGFFFVEFEFRNKFWLVTFTWKVNVFPFFLAEIFSR